MSATPRTDDAARFGSLAEVEGECANLERELQAMTAQRDELRNALAFTLPMIDDATQDANERAGTGELIVRGRWQVVAKLFRRQAEDVRALIIKTGGKL